MSEDEDYDELPKIFVHSSEYAGSFSIPSADELASQRERDKENKRKLSELRERQSVDDELAFVHDSSSSESEAMLSAADTGLSVTGVNQPSASQQYAPRAAHLLHTLAQALPHNARALLEDPSVPLRLSEAVEVASSLVAAEDQPWSDDEVLGVGALLAGAALAHDAAPRPRALRALHVLLERRASGPQGAELCRLLLGALGDVRARLELVDALRAGGAVCAALATQVLDAALLELLEWDAGGGGVERLADAMCARWARLSPELRYAALQLVGRRLASSAPEERDACLRLLAPLAHAHTAHDAQTPDNLKVLVCASKLRLLFANEK